MTFRISNNQYGMAPARVWGQSHWPPLWQAVSISLNEHLWSGAWGTGWWSFFNKRPQEEVRGTPHWTVKAGCRQKEVGPGAQASLRTLGWSAWGSRVRPDRSIQSKKRTVVSSTGILPKSHPRGLTLGGGESHKGCCGLFSRTAIPNLSGIKDGFCGRQFFHRLGVHYIDCAL